MLCAPSFTTTWPTTRSLSRSNGSYRRCISTVPCTSPFPRDSVQHDELWQTFDCRCADMETATGSANVRSLWFCGRVDPESFRSSNSGITWRTVRYAAACVIARALSSRPWWAGRSAPLFLLVTTIADACTFRASAPPTGVGATFATMLPSAMPLLLMNRVTVCATSCWRTFCAAVSASTRPRRSESCALLPPASILSVGSSVRPLARRLRCLSSMIRRKCMRPTS